MSNSPTYAALAEPTRCLLELCQDDSLPSLEQRARLVETYPEPALVSKELAPLADRASRVTLMWSLLSFGLAVASAVAYFKHQPAWQVALCVVVASTALRMATRCSARQGRIDAAQMSVLPLAETGPMSRETIRLLCREVQPLPDFARSDYRVPLTQAHLAWARGLARQARLGRR